MTLVFTELRLRLGRLRKQAVTPAQQCKAGAADAPPRGSQEGVAEALIREEAQHRLANLFQLVTSNLDRAARSLDGSARLALDAAASQVRTLGRLQQEMTHLPSQNGSCGDQVAALANLLNELILGPLGHTLLADVAPDLKAARLPERTSQCLDHIVVEAVINAAKHAFPSGPGGRVSVQLRRDANQLSCSIIDDGTGDLGAPGRGGSRGMRLTAALARQVGGRCRWVFSNSGTRVHVVMPLPALEGGSVRSGNPLGKLEISG